MRQLYAHMQPSYVVILCGKLTSVCGTKLTAGNVDQAKNLHFRQNERNVLLLDRRLVTRVTPTRETCLYHGRLICVRQWRLYDYLSGLTRDFTHGFPRL